MANNLQERLEEIVAEFAADTGSIHLLENGVLMLKAHLGLPPHIVPIVSVVPVGKGMAGQAAERNEPVSVCNLQTDESGKMLTPVRETEGFAEVAKTMQKLQAQLQLMLVTG